MSHPNIPLIPPPSSTLSTSMTATPSLSQPLVNPHTDRATDALMTSALQSLHQRSPPSLHEILGAFTSKGDGDRDMLFALLNAKTAEDNRIAADKNLHRSLLEMYRVQPHTTTPSMYMFETQPHSIPSPPPSTYRESPIVTTRSPYLERHTSRSSTPSHSSDEATYIESRKRRRTRSPSAETRRRHGSLSAVTRSDDPLPPSPYSCGSSQNGSGSPRPRDAMAIDSLTAPRERNVRSSRAQQVSYVRRDDDLGRRHA
ncbi:hypothetical protein BC835DRAFT_1320658 [Cytidiella melzeri]|nr:hypothetical protein BC835DRAFT_1320658 [Cytidiella melzeri]